MLQTPGAAPVQYAGAPDGGHPQGFVPMGLPQQQLQGLVPQGYPPQGYPQGYPAGYPPQPGSPYPQAAYPQQQTAGGMMIMQPPPFGAPPSGAGYMVIPLLAPDLLSALDRLKGVFVQQRIDLLEVVAGCDSKQRYHVSAWDPQLGDKRPNDGRGDELLKFKEESDCCIRLLCGPNRPFSMALFANSPTIGSYHKVPDPITLQDAIVLERPFKCTFLCLARPILKIRHNSMGYIGEIYNPFRILSRDFIIRPPTLDGEMAAPIAPAVAAMPQTDWFRVSGTICQPAMFCFLPCGDCAKVGGWEGGWRR